MVNVKRLLMRILLCVEMCIFGYLYVCGKNGLQLLTHKKQELVHLENQCAALQQDISLLQSDIYAWQTNDFYKEKIAREQLQMARKDDKLFYVGT